MSNSSSCTKDKVINPKTGRCVMKSGKIGMEIENSRCMKDQVINPKTGRCVMKSGQQGRNLLRTPNKMSKRKTTTTSKSSRILSKPSVEIESIVENCKWRRVWKKGTKIGKGAVGTVYTACDSDGCNYILKIQKDDPEFRREVDILLKLKSWVHAPKVFGIWKCKGNGYIVEEKLVELDYSKKISFNKIQTVFDKLHKKFRIVFPDAHEGNIMMRKDGTIVLIDFGWAEHFATKNSKSSVENWLTEKLGRPTTLDEMILWESVNLADAFGTVKHQKQSQRDIRELIKTNR
jgi:hypothetical protein